MVGNMNNSNYYNNEYNIASDIILFLFLFLKRLEILKNNSAGFFCFYLFCLNQQFLL